MTVKWFSQEDRFHCITPLGRGLCWATDPDLPDPEWLVIQRGTGEPFWWQNKFFRVEPNVSNGMRGVSPFMPVNEKTKEHIDRYKALGFLPEKFDPCNVRSWLA